MSRGLEQIAGHVSLMIKPVGASCNLQCGYCYYLPTGDDLYGGRTRRMATATLERLFADYLPRAGDAVCIAWQGGEPTLAGLAFFERAIELQQRYRRADQRVDNALQTNGTLLDDDWGRFLHRHRFLVGISIDGPRSLHDHYRRDCSDHATHAAVMRGLKTLRRHDVEHNLLVVVNDRTAAYPRQVWDYLVSLGGRWLQFIPAVEWVTQDGRPRLADFSPSPAAYGRFLCEVFDAWFERERHRVSVRFFDSVMHTMLGGPATECTYAEHCPPHVTIEHNGDVFACDHFVERRWRLGAVESDVALTVEGRAVDNWMDRTDWERLDDFADRKRLLAESCRVCRWRPLCHGGCPKHRPHRGELPEPTVLCEAYRRFFNHAHPRLTWLVDHLRRGVQPPPP